MVKVVVVADVSPAFDVDAVVAEYDNNNDVAHEMIVPMSMIVMVIFDSYHH